MSHCSVDHLEPEFVPAARAFGYGDPHGRGRLLPRRRPGRAAERGGHSGLLRDGLEPGDRAPATPVPGEGVEGEPSGPRPADARRAVREVQARHRGRRRRAAVRGAAHRPGDRRGPRPGSRRDARSPRARRRGPRGRGPEDVGPKVHRPPGRGPRFRLSVYNYAVGLSPFANGDDRLRFDVLTKTKQPELHRYWTTRERAANLRLFRLVSEVLGAIEAGVFYPNVGWGCKDCPFRSKCWAWGRGRDLDPRASPILMCWSEFTPSTGNRTVALSSEQEQ